MIIAELITKLNELDPTLQLPVTVMDAAGNELPIDDITFEGGGAAPAFAAINLVDEDAEEDDDGDYPPPCTNPGGHKFECTGTAYGGDDERWHGEGRCLCIHCGADGDA